MKIVMTLLGFFFLALGAIGAVLPILPTTPFILLSAACFLRGSTHFRVWFEATRLYQRHAKELVENHAMTKKNKLLILIPVTILLAVLFVFIDNLIVRCVLIAAVVLKWYYFLFKIKTILPSDRKATHVLIE